MYTCSGDNRSQDQPILGALAMNRILDMLADQWLYDVSVLSQGWMIFTIFPAMFYMVFMVFKWTILTMPVWIPFAVVAAIKEG
jgi:hypothetical protein